MFRRVLQHITPVGRSSVRRVSARWVRVLVGTILAAGCTAGGAGGTAPNGTCTAPRSIAITVEVRDPTTGRASAQGAIGLARQGTAVDTRQLQDSLTLLGGQRTGIYDVTVQRRGYATWTQTGVSVTRVGPCGNVEPESLKAFLQPVP
jgi:hypothetical protein